MNHRSISSKKSDAPWAFLLVWLVSPYIDLLTCRLIDMDSHRHLGEGPLETRKQDDVLPCICHYKNASSNSRPLTRLRSCRHAPDAGEPVRFFWFAFPSQGDPCVLTHWVMARSCACKSQQDPKWGLFLGTLHMEVEYSNEWRSCCQTHTGYAKQRASEDIR